jgi:very-short-patch-repair endonuclease
VAAGWLHSLYRRVYAVGYSSLSVRGRYMAAVLACGPEAVLSHRSAADLWGLRRSNVRIAVTVPHRRRAPLELEIHRSRLQEPAHFARLEGIPLTSVARTLLDLAAVLPSLDLARAIDRAERLDLFDLGAIEEVLGRARGRRGAAALRRAVATWRPRHTRSELEDRFHNLLQAAPLSMPQFNVLLEGERGIHEVDAVWTEHVLVVQLDGFAYHRTRRDLERDADTDADLEFAGYRVVRLTWDDVTTHQARTERRLRLLLHRTRD